MKYISLFLLTLALYSNSQTTIIVYPDSLENQVGFNYSPGVFYVPKTTEAQTDFLGNGIHQNAIRTNILESALNNTTNLNDCIAFLDGVSSILQDLSNKTEKVVFIFEKMPVWLSSSSDGSPAATPGWYVLNTKPPANYNDWDAMVSALADRILNTYNINNAYFEIWNEPDLGSWTGTQSEFFELFRHTYDAIKAVDVSLPVGGPATNHWGKNINYQQPYGFINDSIGDLSLIGELIDSTLAWSKPLDFISWHNFNLEYQTNENAIAYINQKYAGYGMTSPELMVSEWNTPSVIRDTPMQRSFFIKSQIEMAKTTIQSNMVAAWQDFSQSSNEFHQDYGLLTYGSIHKPAYKALLLSDKLKGSFLKFTESMPSDVVATVSGDTVSVLVSNYAPLAFIEAFNHTLFEGQFNAEQLDDAGYIDLASSDLSQLDSIYQGLITISGNNPLNLAIINSIPIYDHYSDIENVNRQFSLNLSGFPNDYSGVSYLIDSVNNNSQFTYDSLVVQGLTQSNAIINVTSNQILTSENVNLINGEITFEMQPNAVQLFQFVVPELLGVSTVGNDLQLKVFPNPASSVFEIRSDKSIGEINLLDLSGAILTTYLVNGNSHKIDLSAYHTGCYLLQFVEAGKTVKIIKE